jgi:hypothetical protein
MLSYLFDLRKLIARRSLLDWRLKLGLGVQSMDGLQGSLGFPSLELEH